MLLGNDYWSSVIIEINWKELNLKIFYKDSSNHSRFSDLHYSPRNKP